MTGVGPHPLSRGLLVCNWGLEGPLRFQRDWAWAWNRVVVRPGHRCGGESPAPPLTPTGPRPALCPFGLSFATCEGKISISALPRNLAGQLCRQDKFSSSQGELRQRLSPRECVCSLLSKTTRKQGFRQARWAGRWKSAWARPPGTQGKVSRCRQEGRGDSPYGPGARPARHRLATPAARPQPLTPPAGGAARCLCRQQYDW